MSKESTFIILFTFSSKSLLNPFFLAVTNQEALAFGGINQHHEDGE